MERCGQKEAIYELECTPSTSSNVFYPAQFSVIAASVTKSCGVVNGKMYIQGAPQLLAALMNIEKKGSIFNNMDINLYFMFKHTL